MKLSRVLFLLSMAAFAVSLTSAGYNTPRGVPAGPYNNGWMLLKIGWVGLDQGVFAWLGNPLLLAAWWSFLWKPSWSFHLSLVAVLLMLEFIVHNTLDPLTAGAPRDLIVSRGPAYWYWLSSSILMLAAAVGASFEKAAGKTPEPAPGGGSSL